MDCDAKLFALAEQQQKRYFDAVVGRAAEYGLRAAQLQQEQLAWLAYRKAHCGNVYEFFVQGTVRYEMASACNLRLTEDRTFDLWKAYLTHFGSAAPLLPAPERLRK